MLMTPDTAVMREPLSVSCAVLAVQGILARSAVELVVAVATEQHVAAPVTHEQVVVCATGRAVGRTAERPLTSCRASVSSRIDRVLAAERLDLRRKQEKLRILASARKVGVRICATEEELEPSPSPLRLPESGGEQAKAG